MAAPIFCLVNQQAQCPVKICYLRSIGHKTHGSCTSEPITSCHSFSWVPFYMQISPTTLFFVEGGGQLPYSMCWGDGFVTDPAIIAANGLSDPNLFFTTLLNKPYLNNVVISPHYYPPSISQAKTGCAKLPVPHFHVLCASNSRMNSCPSFRAYATVRSSGLQ